MKFDQTLLFRFKFTTSLADSGAYILKRPLAFHPDIRAWGANNALQLELSQYHSFVRPKPSMLVSILRKSCGYRDLLRDE